MKYTLRPLILVLVGILCFTGYAHAATIQSQWAVSCPLGWTDTQLGDDTADTLHHLGEDKIRGPIPFFCVLSSDPAITLNSEWNPSGSCSAGYSFLGLYDDLGLWTQIDDTPILHNLGENNYRPNGSNNNVWCMQASAPGNAYITYRWPVWNTLANQGPGCAANETRVADSHNFVHNLNYGDRVGANQESLCIMLVNDGACGSANGVQTGAAPSTGLCALGTSSAVTGSGPWNWTCSGANGGSTASCSAPPIPNTAPNAPTITGPVSGNTNASLAYTFTATDADGDTVRYGIDWNNDSVVDEWAPVSLYVGSGVTATANHTWGSDAAHTFRARTQDSKGANSGWTVYTTTTTTPPAPPTALLTAAPSSTPQGGSVTLTYTCSGATSATISGVGAVSPATGGSVTVTPAVTTTYTLTCTNVSGSSTDSVTVTVTPSVPATTACSVSQTVLPSTGGTVTYSANPSGGAGTPFTWTPSDGVGSYGTAATALRTFTSANSGQVYGMTVTGTPASSSNCPNVTVGSVCSGVPTGTITATPNRVKSGVDKFTLTVSNVSNVTTSCIITGPGVNQTIPANACTATGISLPNLGPITTQSVYKLTCDGTKISEAIVNILPNFREF